MADVSQLPQLWTDSEVAEYLGCSERTIARWCVQGEIGYVMVGRRRYFTDKHILEYLERRSIAQCRGSEQTDPARSATIGSAGGRTVPCGAGPGSKNDLDKSAVHRSVQRTLRTRN
jgi:excisionase family DNA binding protein